MSRLKLVRALGAGLPRPALRAAAYLARAVPRAWLYGASFRKTARLLASTERLADVQLTQWQSSRLGTLLEYCYERVPYYRAHLSRLGYPAKPADPFETLRRMPLLTKEYVRRHQSELLANGIDTRQVDDVATGGTSGAPLTFRIQRDRSAVEWAFMTWQWKRIGFRLGDRRVVLRGTQIDGAAAGAISQENPLLDELALSTFALSAANLGQYLETIQEYGPAFLHAYPSSAETLARLLSQTSGLARPRFRGILLGSENLYPSQIDLISQTFATPLFSWYGHSEKCLLGGWCEHTRDFHMFSQYGYLEVLTENGEPCAPGERGVLVGTGFINRVMPFLRYVTDDTAILTDDPCPCGLPYPRVRDVIGRWHGEKLYGTAGRTFTMTALNTHSPVFNRVAQFRLVQERVGEAIVEVVGTEEYTPADSQAIAGEYMNRCGGAISFTVRVVSELPRTRAGKFKFVDQRIPEG